MFGKIKLRLFAVSVVAILLSFFLQGTLAYYSAVGTATNVVTSGNIRFLIHEKTDQGTEFPKEGISVVPGDVVSKEVYIESDCDHPFYLRVKIVYGIDSQELSSEECFKLNVDETVWEYRDGWYYYNGLVQPGQTTPNVFSLVEVVGSEMDNRYLGKTLTLSVVAQGVQSENNPVHGTDTYTALGWPQT